MPTTCRQALALLAIEGCVLGEMVFYLPITPTLIACDLCDVKACLARKQPDCPVIRVPPCASADRLRDARRAATLATEGAGITGSAAEP
jgi:hypothetical protein